MIYKWILEPISRLRTFESNPFFSLFPIMYSWKNPIGPIGFVGILGLLCGNVTVQLIRTVVILHVHVCSSVFYVLFIRVFPVYIWHITYCI
ncbi:hypothetical protein XELAEV_18000483mg [Xenopus laevis]|uniref:Uncharacterized protein n=1 Tax=Xenopus laevis TaxID=8355 RepID=A0A974GYT1_XENLA|nr:hypothetical protein XELAEV_18000483mg [Xenopus laevis]